MTRSELELKITETLTNITDPNMQRLAEDYVRIKYPNRFPHIENRALSPEGHTTRSSGNGYLPDAYYVLPDGRIDGVEATHDKSKTAVYNKLKNEFKKALNSQDVTKLAGFISVSGSPNVNRYEGEVAKLKQRYINELGLEHKNIDFVFARRLIQELAEPQFALTRKELLGIPYEPESFDFIHEKLYPDDKLQGTFIPSSSDYKTGHIYRPLLADTVEKHLKRDRRVLVRGVGASGKTVLAWLIGLNFIKNRISAYYFDFANSSESKSIHKSLIDDIKTFGYSSSLFVLDNIHLNESSTYKVALEWENIAPSQRPKLLLVGRELFIGSGSPLKNGELNISTLALKARQPEVLGVYKRLAWRKTKDTSPPEPKATVLDQWVSTFGGDPSSEDTTTDLIAFSAAVNHKLDSLLQGTWPLSEEDAISEIREVYLNKLEDQEIRNLIQLCSLAELEISINEQALEYPLHGFKEARNKLGLVFQDDLVTSEGRTLFRYRLAHAALGKLLLTAIPGSPVNKEEERLKIAKNYIFSGLAIIQHLNRLGKNDEAENIAKELLKEPQRLIELNTLDRLYNFIELSSKEFKIELGKDIGTLFSDTTNGPKLKKMMWEANFGHITPFLIFSSKFKQLENVFILLSSELVKEENYTRLKCLIWNSCLGHITSFLKLALNKEVEQLDEAFVLVACGIEKGSEVENYDKFKKLIWEASLDHIRQFLEFIIEFEQFKKVFISFIKELSDSEEKLVEKILQANTPLDHLLSFLKITFNKAEALATWLTKKIVEDKKNIEQLVKNAIDASLRNFKSFLMYTNNSPNNQELKDLFNAICEELKKKEYMEPLAEKSSDTPINDLHGFLTFCSDTAQLKPVFDNLIKELMRSEEYRKKLLEKALAFNPDNRKAIFRIWAEKPGLDEIAKYLSEKIA